RQEEARAYLLSLWEEEPGNGTVNLELGRLAVKQGRVLDAQRYYHNAIYGEWGNDPVQQRREVRLELAEFLIKGGELAQAESELIGLSADLPPDPEMQTHVGTLLLRTADYNAALGLFKKALDIQPHLVDALAGAGQAYFKLNDFRNANTYLGRALAENPQLPQVERMLETSRSILDVDPFRRRLAPRERARRALVAFSQATTRLQSCAERRGVDLAAPGGDIELQSVYAQAIKLKPQLREQTLGRDTDLLMTAMDLVFDIEKVCERECGAPQGLDLALVLLAETQGGGRP
ncbi:MAG: tetratricopeptide repeat protein, partial [Acidobacteria bacterium]|nr:tetratricopeptide repeat protein [Acidobacteriota bacterium]